MRPIHPQSIYTLTNFNLYNKLKLKKYKQSDWVIWKPPKKSGLTPKTTKARIVRYAIIQLPNSFRG